MVLPSRRRLQHDGQHLGHVDHRTHALGWPINSAQARRRTGDAENRPSWYAENCGQSRKGRRRPCSWRQEEAVHTHVPDGWKEARQGMKLYYNQKHGFPALWARIMGTTLLVGGLHPQN